jgi:porphyrinogen peroxidase
MAVPQPGIFAQGTRSHYHLEFDLRPDATVADICAAIGRLREPAVTAGGSNIVVGFGAELWRRLRPDDVPVDAGPFETIEGDGHTAPATQHDIWVWTHGTGEDVEFDGARGIAAAFAPVATLALEQPGFVYQDSRDMTGFIDGTENPPVEEAHDVAVIPDGQPGEGGAHVIAMRWVHDLDAFHAEPVEAQEATIGRTKPDSIELDGEAKPPTAHISRVEIHDESGEELPVFRRSTPYGTVEEAGLYFLAFSTDLARIDDMLANMYGTSGDGIRDHLLDFSTPVSGSYFFAPGLESLAAVLPELDDD